MFGILVGAGQRLLDAAPDDDRGQIAMPRPMAIATRVAIILRDRRQRLLRAGRNRVRAEDRGGRDEPQESDGEDRDKSQISEG